ncbi:beta-ketoacyl-[acyl-carrier-protein] synthase family protein [Seonamhaeicola marinus]|uniref:3-oxoacyl-ACP synthase n=1 Tax=Seonamhaeicola marinus TaxID=1912246 RepID=A0A5D0HRJ6_9FLAO|nr:3-oxoacyl-ACP synthase [Seonamhaeicola marinus]TYA73954.1 3-oxoacyl-ACP synthase [Seonamhaeicola marinus]
MNSGIISYCHIKQNQVTLNGALLFEHNNPENFQEFIKSAYNTLETKYPKFFKMDNLSKLSFLAADVILKNEGLDPEEDNNIAIVFSNNASSLDTDRAHQETIQDKNNYFPSPAVFVYTLPNICIGEISIKHKLYSENSFFIFDSFNAKHLYHYSNSLLSEKKADKVLCGWVNFDKDSYEAFIYLVGSNKHMDHNLETIIKLYENKNGVIKTGT